MRDIFATLFFIMIVVFAYFSVKEKDKSLRINYTTASCFMAAILTLYIKFVYFIK